jgi:hypothetical protein
MSREVGKAGEKNSSKIALSLLNRVIFGANFPRRCQVWPIVCKVPEGRNAIFSKECQPQQVTSSNSFQAKHDYICHKSRLTMEILNFENIER